MRTVAVTFTLLGLAGCSTFPAQMAGRFDASPDFIVVEPDGKIFWSPNTDADRQLRFVGIASADKRRSGPVHVTTMSTSQLWPELSYSTDFSRLTVQWREVAAGAANGRSSKYVKVSE